ncbi:hypothetical protein WJ75_08610 [Burkholderia ubonensis]|nr:hypothetical protein WJ75_08610 [Burkholderia ubonensis]
MVQCAEGSSRIDGKTREVRARISRTSRQVSWELAWSINATIPETVGAADDVPPNSCVYALNGSVVVMPGVAAS